MLAPVKIRRAGFSHRLELPSLQLSNLQSDGSIHLIRSRPALLMGYGFAAWPARAPVSWTVSPKGRVVLHPPAIPRQKSTLERAPSTTDLTQYQQVARPLPVRQFPILTV
jgi:hypothetical protein